MFYSYCLRMEGVMIEERFNSWFRTHPRNGYEPCEWEFKRGPMVENYETIHNPWGTAGIRWISA